MTDVDEANGSSRRVDIIRREMNFELGILHDRINTLISFEAFLLICFTMSLTYAGGSWAGKFFWIAPSLSMVGIVIPILAWPGVHTSFSVLSEWNRLLIETLAESKGEPGFVWMPSGQASGGLRTRTDHRNGMLFARFVPLTFIVAWSVLIGIVLTAPLR